MAIAQIALADDHPLFAEGIRRLLETEYEIIATALDGRELLQRLQEADPNVVIVDIGMPILNGIVTTQRLKESKPNIKIVVVSQHTDRSFLRAAFSAGADAYVTKQSSPNELREAVRRVLGGEVYVSPALVEARALAGLDPRIHAELIFGDHLTHRQREVLQLIAEGKSIKEMAHLLGVSQKTIEFHKANLMDLVGLRTTAELTRYALQHGLAGPLSPEVGGVRARQIIVNTR